MDNSAQKLQELNKAYEDGITLDREVFAEQRSNVLLVSGEHYNRKNWKWLSHVRENMTIENEQKIRLTRNHVSRIYKNYINKFVSLSPGTAIAPQNEKELKDQKASELHGKVWSNIKYRHTFAKKVHDWVSSFVGIGEVFVKISWDWEKGNFKKKEIQYDELGQPIGEKDLWTGDLVYEQIFGFDVFRPKDAKSLDDAEWVGFHKMVDVSVLKNTYKDDDDILKKLEPDGKTTYLVFDDSGFKDSKNTVLVKEIYYKPSYEYPNGYFYIFTQNVVLADGELPAGKFPIKWCLFDEFPTHPRGRSHIKQLKPYQVEINRVGSKMAEHQITLGDDKLVLTHGGKMSAGGHLNGVRAISVTGQSPLVIPGRTGEQYLGYANSIIAELYQVAMLSEELEEKQPAQIDPYALLLTSSKWKARFSMHSQKLERFLIEVTELSLELYRHFIEEDTLIYDIGTGEIINIPEFKNSQKLCYQIKVEAQSEDIESRIGKKMSIDRYIQYAAGQLQKEDLGKFLRLDPYLNKEQMFADFTSEYDNSVNDILAMDRGELPLVNEYKYADPNYPIKRFTARMSQSDFSYLPPQAQQMYVKIVQLYSNILQKKIQDTAALNSQFIPSGGALVRSDMWVPDPKDPSKQVRASFPYEALSWLKGRMDEQGSTQEALNSQRQAVISDMANQMRAASQPPQMSPQAMQLQSMLQKTPQASG